MNNIYKVIWSKAKNCYVVASEIARSHTKSASGSEKIGGGTRRKLLASLMALSLLCGGLGVASASLEVVDQSGSPGTVTIYTKDEVDNALTAKGAATDVASNKTDIETLKTAVGNAGSGLTKDVADQKADIATNKADISTNKGNITALQNELGNKADKAAVTTALGDKANTDLSNLTADGETKIKETMSADMDLKANRADVYSRTDADNTFATKKELNAKADVTALDGKADQTALDAATNRIAANEGEITALKNKTGQLSADGKELKDMTTVSGTTVSGDNVKAGELTVTGEIKDGAGVTTTLAKINDSMTQTATNKTDIATLQTTTNNQQTAIDDLKKRTTKIGYDAANDITSVNGMKVGQQVDMGGKNLTNVGTINGIDLGTKEGGNYISQDGSIWGNMKTVDTQVKTNANNIETNKNAITTLDTKVGEIDDRTGGIKRNLKDTQTTIEGKVTVDNSGNVGGVKNLSAETINTTGNAAIGGALGVTGETTLDGALTAKGEATFKDKVSVEKDLTVDGKLNVGEIYLEHKKLESTGKEYDSATSITADGISNRAKVTDEHGNSTESKFTHNEKGTFNYATDKDGNKTYTKVTATENSFQVQDKDAKNKNHQVNTKDSSVTEITNAAGATTKTEQTATDIKNTAEQGTITNTAQTIVNNATGDMTNTVGGKLTTTVAGQATEKFNSGLDTNVTGKENHTVTGDQNIHVTGKQTNEIGGNQENTIGGSQTTTVEGKVTENYKNGQETTVTGDKKTTVTGKTTEEYKGGLETTVTGDEKHTVTGNQTTNVTGDISNTAKNITNEANETLTDKVGTNTRVTTSTSITDTVGTTTNRKIEDGKITDTAGDSTVTTENGKGTTFAKTGSTAFSTAAGAPTDTNIAGNHITTGRVDANELGVSDKDGNNSADLSVKAGEGVKASASDGATTGSLDVKADEVGSSVTDASGKGSTFKQRIDAIMMESKNVSIKADEKLTNEAKVITNKASEVINNEAVNINNTATGIITSKASEIKNQADKLISNKVGENTWENMEDGKITTSIKDGTKQNLTQSNAAGTTQSTVDGAKSTVTIQNADGLTGAVTDGRNTSVQNQTASAIATDVKDGAGNENASVANATTSANTITNGTKANTVISTADGTSFINSDAMTPVTGASGAGTAVNTTIKGNTITTGKVKMDYAEVMRDLGVHGSAKVDNDLEVGGTTTTNTLKVTKNATVGGTLDVTQRATFHDAVDIAKDLSVGGNATIAGDVTAKSYKVGDKTYISAAGINANDQKITNVADGSISEGSKDAVNGGQLYTVKNDLEGKVNKVGANAAAMANLHPMEFDPDSKWNIAAAIGNYGSETAAALGAFYRPNDDVMVNLSTAFGTGENMVGGGVSVRLGKGGNKLSREESNALKDQVNDLTARMDALLSVLNPNMSKDFPDVPENHWAYEAVSRLAGNDIVQGYPDGEFHGDRTMTRYEMAEIIYNALSRGAEAEKELVEEFKPELQAMTASEKATAERAEG